VKSTNCEATKYGIFSIPSYFTSVISRYSPQRFALYVWFAFRWNMKFGIYYTIINKFSGTENNIYIYIYGKYLSLSWVVSRRLCFLLACSLSFVRGLICFKCIYSAEREWDSLSWRIRCFVQFSTIQFMDASDWNLCADYLQWKYRVRGRTCSEIAFRLSYAERVL